MATHNRRLERTFVVRLWREAGARADAVRGTAEDVGDGERLAFGDLRQLEKFLRQRLFGSDPPSC